MHSTIMQKFASADRRLDRAAAAADVDHTISNSALHAALPVLTVTSGLSAAATAVAHSGMEGWALGALGAGFSLLFGVLWRLNATGSTPTRLLPWMPGLTVNLCWLQAGVWLVAAPDVALLSAIPAIVASWWLFSTSQARSAAVVAVALFLALRLTPMSNVAWGVTGLALSVLLYLGVRLRAARIRSVEAWLQRREEAEAEARRQAEEEAAEAEAVSKASEQKPEETTRILEARGEMDGLWEWHLSSDRFYFSPRWRALLGYEESSVTGSPEDWFNLVHAYDLNELLTRLRAHLDGESDRFELEHRIRQADGSYRWVYSHGRVVLDDAGNPTRMAGSQIDIKRMKNYEAQLIHQATHDRLTGLPNREKLQELIVEDAARRQQNQSYRYALAFLDLDDFKGVNDTLGHAAGDRLLEGVARRLKAAVRPEDVVARLGGDEFVLIFRGLRGPEEATEIAERVVSTVRESFNLAGQVVAVDASIGVALCDDADLGAETILRNADIAMYSAKKSGKGRVSVFDPEMGWQASRQFELQTQLRKAFENEELELHYQPIFSAQDGRIICAEALMRWRREDGEITPPSEFIPLAEEIELIHDMGRWAIREAAKQVVAWSEAGLPLIEVSVNVSAKQLRRHDFATAVRAALVDSGLDSRKLQLEITESDLVDGRDQAPEILDRLSLLGIRTAIDDFGVGYSSLSYLRDLRCDTLKIDRSFVQGLASDAKSAAIVRSIIQLAHNLELSVVAEGVETPAQIDFLRGAGCDRLQGYFASKPLPAREFVRLLQAGARIGIGPAKAEAQKQRAASGGPVPVTA